MPKDQKSAQWIAFEGIDGCGKSSQLSLLCAELDLRQISYVCVRDPGGTTLSEEIREILLKPRSQGEISSIAELMLYNASRAQLIEEKIKPALAQGKWVLSDRFAWSTYAYQGNGRGIPQEQIRMAVAAATNGLKPDQTFYLDIDLKCSLQRRNSRGGEVDRLESEKTDFFERVIEGYRKIAIIEESVFQLNGENSQTEIFDQIKKRLF